MLENQHTPDSGVVDQFMSKVQQQDTDLTASTMSLPDNISGEE